MSSESDSYNLIYTQHLLDFSDEDPNYSPALTLHDNMSNRSSTPLSAAGTAIGCNSSPYIKPALASFDVDAEADESDEDAEADESDEENAVLDYPHWELRQYGDRWNVAPAAKPEQASAPLPQPLPQPQLESRYRYQAPAPVASSSHRSTSLRLPTPPPPQVSYPTRYAEEYYHSPMPLLPMPPSDNLDDLDDDIPDQDDGDEYRPSPPPPNPRKRRSSSSHASRPAKKARVSPSKPASSTTARRSAPGSRNPQAPDTPVDYDAAEFKCPFCGYEQRNSRKPDFQRHVATHQRKDNIYEAWWCKGIPVGKHVSEFNRMQLNHGRSKLIDLKATPIFFNGEYRIGGCKMTFSRRDALKRHLDNPAISCAGYACRGIAEGFSVLSDSDDC